MFGKSLVVKNDYLFILPRKAGKLIYLFCRTIKEVREYREGKGDKKKTKEKTGKRGEMFVKKREERGTD